MLSDLCPPQLASQPAGAAPSAFQALWEISMQQIDAPGQCRHGGGWMALPISPAMAGPSAHGRGMGTLLISCLFPPTELWCPSLGEVGQALQRLGAHQATLSPPGQLPLELLPPAPR